MAQIVNGQGIAQGFSALAQALAPQYGAAIQADLARRQGGVYDAQAGLYGAQGRNYDAQTAGITDKNAALKAAAAGFASVLDPTSPTGLDMAALGKIYGGGAYDPAFLQQLGGALTGMASLGVPGYAQRPEFSNILTGTGVQPYQNTPQGVADANAAAVKVQETANAGSLATQLAANTGSLNTQAEANKGSLAVQDSANAGAADVQSISNQGALNTLDKQMAFILAHPTLAGALPGVGNASQPLQVSPLDVARGSELVAADLKGRTGVAPSQDVVNTVLSVATTDFQQGPNKGNFSAAVANALAQFKVGTSGVMGDGTNSTLNPFNWPMWNSDKVVLTPLAGALSGGASSAAGNPAAGGTVAPSGAAGGGAPQLGYTAPDGRFFPEGSVVPTTDGKKWVVQNGTPVQVP